MKNKEINGTQFEEMLKGALINLSNHEKEINEANVFPVPDGDTGTNMVSTLENGLNNITSNNHLGSFLKELCAKILLGARGNSGVILSQIFKGMYKELEHDGIVNACEMTDALISGYKEAYDAVIHPVEGTILTVAREGIENIKVQVSRKMYVENMLSLYLAEMRKSLASTPDMLPLLKEAGVVDSGAMGYIYIIEGMVKVLYGEVIQPLSEGKVTRNSIASSSANVIADSSFNEDSKFEYGYCMEFILQLLKSDKYAQDFNIDNFIEDIKPYGNSLVCFQNDTRIKVHIHTYVPDKVIRLGQQYGEFVTFKLENMQLQHNEYVKNLEKEEKKPFAIIAVANGLGMINTLKDLGADYVIDGGITMSTSPQEFVNAFKAVNSSNIVVLPNCKNIICTANQAKGLYSDSNITVIPTTSMAEGYFALAMDVGDSSDYNYRIKKMQEGSSDVYTITVSRIIKDCCINNINCKKGEYVAILNGKPVASNRDYLDCLLISYANLIDINRLESCLIFRGKTIDEDKEEEITERIVEKYPNLEVVIVDGSQETFDLIVGII